MLFQFPEPYPGESLYSIFCRFHERSGNRTHKASICQLFGKVTSQRSSVLSPALLPRATDWFDPSGIISIDTLRDRHTMFNYGRSLGGCLEYKIATKNGKEECQYYTARNYFHHTKKLRYCPCCTRQQKILYGEAYWQVLPQLEGVDVCPIHGEPYRNSQVSLSDIGYRYYPASSVLTEDGNKDDIPDNLDQIESNHQFFLIVSQESQWLLENGSKFASRRSKVSTEYIAKTADSMDPRLLQEYFLECGYHYQMPQEKAGSTFSLIVSYFLDPAKYIYLIHHLCGSFNNYSQAVPILVSS